jgi:SP family general alpha glucoside:H+ symporter-like MFS transporter
METEKTVPGHQNQGADPSLAELVHQAQGSEEADSRLTIMQAVVKYKKAVWWAMFLSTSLIMEGYDLVLVSSLSL